MKTCSFLLVLVAFATAYASLLDIQPLSDEYIDAINVQQTSWIAKRNFPLDTPLSWLKQLLGAILDEDRPQLPLQYHSDVENLSIPESFDAREQWSNCPTIKEIRNQAHCGSCWAFGAVEAMSDRVCIHSGGKVNFHFSAEDLVSCCPDCGRGCNGGYSTAAWKYWVEEGVVSGGSYGSQQGCMPYEIRPENSYENIATPVCRKVCETNYNVSYARDKHYGNSSYSLLNNVEQIQAEILKNGPVEAGFVVYEDFFQYNTQVYRHVSKVNVGGHDVKIIGWGVEKGTPYWLVANSWGTQWGGLGGFFKILRGANECDIENNIVAGLPA